MLVSSHHFDRSSGKDGTRNLHQRYSSKVRVTVRMVKRSFQLITGSMSRHTEGLRRTGTMTSKYVDLFSKYTSTWSKLIVGAKSKYRKPFS